MLDSASVFATILRHILSLSSSDICAYLRNRGHDQNLQMDRSGYKQNTNTEKIVREFHNHVVKYFCKYCYNFINVKYDTHNYVC